jgi:hypothetical protein
MEHYAEAILLPMMFAGVVGFVAGSLFAHLAGRLPRRGRALQAH